MSTYDVSEEGATPDAPSAGRQLIYPKSDGWYVQNSAGVEEQLSGTNKSPAFSAHKNGTDQTGLASGIWAKVTFSTELFDSKGDFASSTFTPSVPGKYLLTAQAQFQVMLLNELCVLGIYKNGALYQQAYVKVAINSTNNQVSITAIVDANGTTDYFELYAIVTSASDRSIEGTDYYTRFAGSKVG